MKRVLVTGNRGYIGTNLTKYLSARGFKVGGIDKKDRLLCEDFKLPKKHDLFGIVHLAATSSIDCCESNAELAVKDNIIGSQNIFEEAANANVPVIVASSQAVKNPKNVYALTKVATEMFAEFYNCQGANIKILRFANVYGGENFVEEKTSVIAKFLRAKQRNEPLIVNGSGAQTRDFIHVDDICEAIMLALYHLDQLSEPLDIGTGKEVTILSIAKMISNNIKFNKNSDVVGVTSNVADIHSAKNILCFNAKRDIREFLI